METFGLSELIARRAQSERLYLEFLRVPTLSAGIYALPAEGVDPQQPHTEDEVYYVVRGRGRLMVGEEDHVVEAGSIVYVQAGVEHRFHTILEDLVILVFFAPPERTGAQG